MEKNQKYTKMNFSDKPKFIIERHGTFSWIFRKEGFDEIIKRHKDKRSLIEFTKLYCSNLTAIVKIYDDNGMLNCMLEFSSLNKK